MEEELTQRAAAQLSITSTRQVAIFEEIWSDRGDIGLYSGFNERDESGFAVEQISRHYQGEYECAIFYRSPWKIAFCEREFHTQLWVGSHSISAERSKMSSPPSAG